MLDELKGTFEAMGAQTGEAFGRALIAWAAHTQGLCAGDDSHRQHADQFFDEMQSILAAPEEEEYEP
tara:strand:+ start:3829 stop:4029 length:201 start_codon:yes stop_codon:yes gene_type:complete